MKKLLIIFTLLISFAVQAKDESFVLTGISVEKGQVVEVTLMAPLKHLFVFSVQEDLTANDEVVLYSNDVEPGKYTILVVVRESTLGKVLHRRITLVEVE